MNPVMQEYEAMTNLNNIPFPSDTAVSYSWSQLALRAGVPHEESTNLDLNTLGVKVRYGDPDQSQSIDRGIIIARCRKEAWQRLLTRPDHSLSKVSLDQLAPGTARLPFTDPLPVIFWGAGSENGKPFVKLHRNGTVIFYADLLASAFFMLSRWEETVVMARDHHDRFPATASVAYKQGFLGRPIVDEYALILQVWLKMLVPNWVPQVRRFSVKLSHDIDHVRSASLRKLSGDIIKRKNLAKALDTVRHIRHPYTDPYMRGCYDLADLSEQHDFQSAFYFKSAERGPMDSGYDPRTNLIQRCIQELRRRGHELGFHPGYTTFNDPERFMAEKHRMDVALREEHYGGRQHYLRFHVPHTWHLWEQADLAYDASMGYADHVGFRCGTCHPYHPFDVEQGRQIELLEIPLIVMDGVLEYYLNLTPETGEELILALALRCRRVNGVFSILWHNTSLQWTWEPWAVMYRRILPRLAALVI